MGNRCCTPNLPPPFMNKQMVNILAKRNNLFEQTLDPYRGNYRTQWMPVGTKFMYRGEQEGYLRHGRGLMYNKESHYIVAGFFFENRLVQYNCRKIYSDGRQYFGELNSSYEQHGWGRIVGPEYIYEGGFKNGEFDGNGKLQNLIKNKSFKGVFVEGQKRLGIEETEQQIYDGQFMNNLRQGEGSIRIKKTNLRYVGKFQKNMLQGEVKVYTGQSQFFKIAKFHDNVMV